MYKYLLALPLVLAACSTPAPDASGMKAGPQLTMPPSYDLRPPKAEQTQPVQKEQMAEVAEEKEPEQKAEEKSFWSWLLFWK